MTQHFSVADVKKVSLLASIPISDREAETIAQGFTKTMEVVDQLNSVSIGDIDATHHVTGILNVMREDVVDEKRMFTQEQALANARRTYNGFFVVDQVIDQE